MLLPWKAAMSKEIAEKESLRRERAQMESSVILIVASYVNIRNKSND
jgi:hypothetical protein